jgi:hypothetical protein
MFKINYVTNVIKNNEYDKFTDVNRLIFNNKSQLKHKVNSFNVLICTLLIINIINEYKCQLKPAIELWFN